MKTYTHSTTQTQFNYKAVNVLNKNFLASFLLFFTLLFSGRTFAQTDLTNCYNSCTANDFTITEAYLSSDCNGTRLTSDACANDADGIINAFLSFTFRNNTSSDRDGIFISGTINGQHIFTCFPGVLPKQTSTTFTYCTPVQWQCNTDLTLQNTFIGWGSAGEEVCDITCNQATPSKCRTVGAVIIVTPLEPEFTFTPKCETGNLYETICFTNATTGGHHNYSFKWDFGDGATSTAEDPCHTYTSAGDFIVKLTVTDVEYLLDDDGNPTSTVISTQTKSISHTVTVNTCCKVVVDATATPTELDLAVSNTVQLNAVLTGSNDTDPTHYNFLWSQDPPAGGSLANNIKNPVFTATAPGSYTFTVTATLKTNSSCTATDMVTVNVSGEAPPCSVFGPSPVCPGSTNTYVYDPTGDGAADPIPTNYTVLWTLETPNGATISGVSNTNTVKVIAGTECNKIYRVKITLTSTSLVITRSCFKDVTVEDNTPPVITCVAQTTPISCPATPVFVAPTATDDCDATPTITFEDKRTEGDCAGTYSVTRTWTATDDCGNTSTCSRTIVVRDVTPPVITCVAQTTPINCPATPVFVAPTATDACDATPTITFEDNRTEGSCAGTYSVTRTWTATDNCGNTSTCSRTIVVRDVTPPVITCVAQTTPISCPATPVFKAPTATDACDATPTITFEDNRTEGSCAGTYSVTRIWTATDDCGNTSTCSRTIVVRDVTPPVITCVAQTTPISCPATPVFVAPTATDDCDETPTITFEDKRTEGDCAGTYSVTRTWTATDDCGNTSTCSRTIVVRDVTPPVITCVAQTTPISCPATPVFVAPTATDACDATPTITFEDNRTEGSCAGTYSVTRTWKATDNCGNTSTCSRTIVVRDVTPPVITCVAQTTPISCPATPVFKAPTATDACDATPTITFEDNRTEGSCAGTYSVTRTWTATDDCGNTSTCSRTIVVRDVTPPVITCVAQTTPISCPATPVFKAPTATDACDATPTITFEDNRTEGSCAGTYSVTRTWTATDDCGNTSTCSRTIVVRDVTPPVITCVAQTTPISCPATPVFVAPTATDACDATPTITFEDNRTEGSCAGTYSVTRTWKATDNCGNTSTCSRTIVVRDVTPPVITCVAQTTPISCPATPVFKAPTATDACDATPTITFEDNRTEGSCAGTYSVTRTWKATDDCGNTSTCSRTIVVRDVTPPVITCVAQTTPISCPATPVFKAPTATDGCDATPTITFEDKRTEGSCAGTYSVTRTWKATDDCGNTSTCSRTIVVRDVTPPVITCVAQTTPISCPATPVFVAPTATDACDATPTITFADNRTEGSCAGTYSVTRTWKATDDCGNTSTCSRTIVVRDVTPPVITCAGNKLIECGAAVVFTLPTAKDGCDATPTITIVSTVDDDNVHTRTWKATDDCGNTATCSQTITTKLCPHTFPTQTTCCNFQTKTATQLLNICYTASGGVVTNAIPGVFFYYTTLVAPASSFTVNVDQTDNNAGFKTFIPQNSQNIRLFSSNCTTKTITASISGGNATLVVTGAIAGQTYVVSVKYDTKSIIGSPTGSVLPNVLYTFKTYTTVSGGVKTHVAGSTGTLTAKANCADNTPLPPSCTMPAPALTVSTPAEPEALRSVKLEATAYPNPAPARGSFMLRIVSSVSGTAVVEYFNVNGSKLAESKKQVLANTAETVLFNGSASGGTIMYKVTVEGQTAKGIVVRPN
jgi:hypothetical protein